MTAIWMEAYKNVQDMSHEENAARRLAEQRAKVAERDLARHKERDREWKEEHERRSEADIADWKALFEDLKADTSKYFEEQLTKWGCVHCQCKKCLARGHLWTH